MPVTSEKKVDESLSDRFVIASKVAKSRYFFRPKAVAAERSERLVPVYGGFEECAPDYWLTRESQPFPAIEFVVGGKGSFSNGEQQWNLRPGSVFFHGRNDSIEIRSDPKHPLVKYFLCVRGIDDETKLMELGLASEKFKQALSPFPLQRVMDDLIDEGQSVREGADEICLRLVELLLLKINSLAGGDETSVGVAETTFLRCKGIIERESLRLRSLAEIVRRVEVESAHLCRLFRRFQGQSPYQYLLRHKMTLAAEHLVQTSCLVKEAAEYVGMDDVYHFSRLFKKLFHISPGEFRRSMGRA